MAEECLPRVLRYMQYTIGKILFVRFLRMVFYKKWIRFNKRKQVVQMTWYLEHGGKGMVFSQKYFFLQYNLIGVSYGHDFLPTQRARLSGPPRYLERVRKAYRKFSRGTFQKSFSSKHEVLSEYSDLTLSFIFQNLNFCHFSWHIIRLVCRMLTIFFSLTHAST